VETENWMFCVNPSVKITRKIFYYCEEYIKLIKIVKIWLRQV